MSQSKMVAAMIGDKFMKRRIYVTPRHINDGMQDSETACMIALSLIDAGFVNPSVFIGLAYDDEGISIDGAKPVDFPDSLSEKICGFEFGRTVSPFYFDMWLIDGDIVQVGDAVDMPENTDDCGDLIAAIDQSLAEIKEPA